MQPNSNLGNIKNAFCMKYVIPPERFDRAVFWRCVHERGSGIARVILFLYPGYFRRELQLIQQIGRYTEMSEVQGALQRYHKETQSDGGFIRRKLKVRLSGERLLRLAAELLMA